MEMYSSWLAPQFLHRWIAFLGFARNMWNKREKSTYSQRFPSEYVRFFCSMVKISNDINQALITPETYTIFIPREPCPNPAVKATPSLCSRRRPLLGMPLPGHGSISSNSIESCSQGVSNFSLARPERSFNSLSSSLQGQVEQCFKRCTKRSRSCRAAMLASAHTQDATWKVRRISSSSSASSKRSS